MKILLVHPGDSVEAGPWIGTNWDLIVDLGWSGRYSYAEQTKRSGCRVLSMYDLLDRAEHRRRLQDLLAVGLNLLIDSEGIDWWEAFSVSVYQPLEELMLLTVLADEVPEDAEIRATRSHFAVRALSILRGREIGLFLSDRQTGIGTAAARYLKKVLALRPSQIVEIALDKWDTDYRLRRLLTRRPPDSSTPAVLLASAYVNVSRIQLAYAAMLPHLRFILVVTRRSGRRVNLPSNVELRSLAAYAPGFSAATENESLRLLAMWEKLQDDRFTPNRVLGLARKLVVFDEFGSFLRTGLKIRDAWRNVLSKEPITAVLSGDENNAFTRLPTLLAAPRRLRTVFCDHGALNMTLGIRRACSDTYLAAGDMARDYVTVWCGLPADRVVVGGPQKAVPPLRPSRTQDRNWIVFFSEAYELFSGRTQTLYAQLLPQLCSLARQTNRRVIVKLHPFESFRVRNAIIGQVLSAEDRTLVELREGPITSDLFERAWFSVTVESSVAVESTMNGVPCFLCDWFNLSWSDYAKQYAKYSAGYALDSPERVRQIPHLLEQIKISEATLDGLQTTIRPERLESVLSRK